MSNIFNSREYKVSRAAYIGYCVFDYFVGILVAGSFLAKLLTHMGIRPEHIGIISSFISLAFLLQLMSMVFVNKIRNTKAFSMTFMAVAQLLFMTLFLIPSFGLKKSMGAVFANGCIIMAYFALYFISLFIAKWANSFVNPDTRGKFSAVKELISLIAGMVFTLAVSFVFDWFEARGKIEHGFIFFAVSIFVCSVLTFISLFFIRSDKREKANEEKVPVKESLRYMIKNKKFLCVMTTIILFKCASYMTAGFLGTYQTVELGFSLGTLSVITTLSTLLRMVVTVPFGVFSDRTSFAKGMFLGFVILAFAYLALVFTSPALRWLIVLYFVFNYVSAAGTGQNAFNIMYKCVDQKYFIHANAVTNSVSGILAFMAALLGGKILGSIGPDGIRIFGTTVFGQQVLGGISFIIMLVAVIFSYFTIIRPENKNANN